MTQAVPPTPPHDARAAASRSARPIDAPALEEAGGGSAPGLFAHWGGIRFQALLAVGLKGGAAASALLLQWLIARIYGPEGTGMFALMATTAVFIGVLAVAGQDFIALRNVAGDLAEGKPESARAHARASLRIAAFGTVLGTVALAATALAYGAGLEPAMTPVLLLALPVVAGLSLGRVCAFVARAGGRVIASQLPDGPITSAVAVSLLGLALAVGGVPPSWTLGAIYGAAYLAALLFAAWLYRTVRQGWPKPERGSEVALPLRPIVLAGLPMMVANALPYFSDWLVIFTTTALLGPEAAGQIRIVTLFLSVMYLVTIALDSVLSPAIAGAIRLRDRTRVRRLYRNYTALALALNVPLMLVGAGFPELYLGLFGPEFVPIAPALRIAVALQALSILLGPAGIVLVMAHREQWTLAVNAVGLVVLAIGCALVIPAWGAFGGALVGASVLLSKRATEVALMRRLVWPSL